MAIGIYKITNTVNGKFYIGSSKNIEIRWRVHRRNLRKIPIKIIISKTLGLNMERIALNSKLLWSVLLMTY